MSQPYLGEIRMFAGNFEPVGWAFCNGQLLSIAQNNALFALLGTTYGGDGQNTFALPDLQGRVPIHFGTGNGLGTVNLADKAGSETVTITAVSTPTHSHAWAAVGDPGSADKEKLPGGYLANGALSVYDASPTTTTALDAAMIAPPAVGNGAHENMAPFLAVTFIIALEGIFPSQN
jgi:microcystin-dependent protein